MSAKLNPPITICLAKAPCWKCHKSTRVLGFWDNVSDTFLSFVTSMPEDLYTIIRTDFPFYFLDYSKTIQGKYYSNHCEHCSALQGDHFLTQGMAFDNAHQCVRMLVTLPYDHTIHLDCSGSSYGDMLENMAAELRPKPQNVTLSEYLNMRREYLARRKQTNDGNN